MVKFIDDHRGAHGVEPICEMLPIAPATYYEHLAKRADPARLSDRAKSDEALRPEIQRVFDANWQVYGVRKIWRQLRREGFDVARCTVARLMKSMGIQGIIRGKPQKTTIPDKRLPCPLDKVNRQFRVPAPNMLWVSDFTYVATWKGFVYVAFVIDAYARKIVGWRVSTSPHAGFVLDALEQAVHDGARSRAWAWFTTVIAEASICRSNIPNDWLRQASNLRSEAWATVMTTLSPRQSTACSRLRSSIAAARGAASRLWNMQPSNGSTGSTTVACSSQSGTFPPPKPKQTSTQLWKLKPWPRN